MYKLFNFQIFKLTVDKGVSCMCYSDFNKVLIHVVFVTAVRGFNCSVTSAKPTLDPGGFIHSTQKTKASAHAALPLKIHSPLVYEMAAIFCRICTKLKISLHLSPFKELVVLLLFKNTSLPPFYKIRMFVSLLRTAFIIFLSPECLSHFQTFRNLFAEQ
jgi:hypothetical protein